MLPNRVPLFQYDLFESLYQLSAQRSMAPLYLGGSSGSSGGTGGPPGGVIGLLPQTKVAYDTTEASTSSGSASLLNNLNRIRGRLATLEAGGFPSLYGGSPADVGGAAVVGSSGSSSPGDHVHRGVTSIAKSGSAQVFGDVFLVQGSNVTLTQSGGSITIAAASSGSETRSALFTVEGALAVATGKIRIYNKFGVTKTISAVFLSVNTAPTGAAIIVDVNLGGVTIFTTQSNRPQIAASAFTGLSGAPDVTAWADGNYLQMDVDAIGSGVAGSDLTVHVLYS